MLSGDSGRVSPVLVPRRFSALLNHHGCRELLCMCCWCLEGANERGCKHRLHSAATLRCTNYAYIRNTSTRHVTNHESRIAPHKVCTRYHPHLQTDLLQTSSTLQWKQQSRAVPSAETAATEPSRRQLPETVPFDCCGVYFSASSGGVQTGLISSLEYRSRGEWYLVQHSGYLPYLVVFGR